MTRQGEATYIILAKNAEAGKAAAAYLQEKHIESRLFVGSYAGEIGKITRELTGKASEKKEPVTLLIAGGDGLLNEVLGNIMDFKMTTLALIPAGSGNDFARAMGISKDPQEAVKRALEGTVHLLDHGRVVLDHDEKTARRFIVSIGAGFDADVCNGADHFPLRKILGSIGQAQFIYTLAAVPKLLRCKHVKAQIAADGKLLHDKKAFFAAVMNTAYEGGGYKFCPDADPENRRLNMMIASGIRLWSVPKLLMRCRKGTHKKMKQVQLTEAKEVMMLFDETVWVHTDGEIIGKAREVMVNCVPGKVRFLL